MSPFEVNVRVVLVGTLEQSVSCHMQTMQSHALAVLVNIYVGSLQIADNIFVLLADVVGDQHRHADHTHNVGGHSHGTRGELVGGSGQVGFPCL